jgi:hypothetical protein
VAVVPPAGVLELPAVDVLDGVVPCGRSSSVYFVPSAVFWSVTGVFSLSVIVGAPVAYEPPTTPTVATFAVSVFRTNSCVVDGNTALTATDSDTPLMEITAEVIGGVGGAGGVGGGVAGGLLEPEPEPDGEPEPDEEPDPDDDPEPEACAAGGVALAAANGSLLSNNENDCN